MSNHSLTCKKPKYLLTSMMPTIGLTLGPSGFEFCAKLCMIVLSSTAILLFLLYLGEYQDNLNTRHSFYESRFRDSAHSEASWKSDMNLTNSQPLQLSSTTRSSQGATPRDHSAEYYKRYEHDEIPVKDEAPSNRTINIERNASGKASLTNSDLEKLENKIYKTISQELQTDDSSISSLESNIKFFRTTVQEIFDNFNTSMQDFELYKKRFEDILAKNRYDSIADMEDFIKDMIHHMSSDSSSISHESRHSAESPNLEIKEADDPSSTTAISDKNKEKEKLLESLHSVVEAYKNENYLTDSTVDDRFSKLDNCTKKEEIFNIYLLSGVPCVQIKMNDRNLLSEINIKDQIPQEGNRVASAENLKKLADKKLELEKYVRQQQENHAPDREIPVKISFPKKNIHLNEDFAHERDKDERSLMSKICSYICRKFRKT